VVRFLVHERSLVELSMVPDESAVVSRVNDDGIFCEFELVECVEHPLDFVVDERNVTEILAHGLRPLIPAEGTDALICGLSREDPVLPANVSTQVGHGSMSSGSYIDAYGSGST